MSDYGINRLKSQDSPEKSGAPLEFSGQPGHRDPDPFLRGQIEPPQTFRSPGKRTPPAIETVRPEIHRPRQHLEALPLEERLRPWHVEGRGDKNPLLPGFRPQRLCRLHRILERVPRALLEPNPRRSKVESLRKSATRAPLPCRPPPAGKVPLSRLKRIRARKDSGPQDAELQSSGRRTRSDAAGRPRARPRCRWRRPARLCPPRHRGFEPQRLWR